MLKLVIISGSARPERTSHQVALALKEVLDSKDSIHVDLLDVKEYNFPLLDQVFRKQENPSGSLKEFHEKLDQMDGMLIVSPEYNNSFSGAIKNTMDYFYPEYKHKAAGLVTVSTGKMGGINAAKHLQHYALTLQAIVYPQVLTTPEVTEHFEDGKLKDGDYADKLHSFLDKFIRFTEVLSAFRNE